MGEKEELLMDLEKANFILFTELPAVLSKEQLEIFARRAIERAVINCEYHGTKSLRGMLPSEIIGMLREAVEKSNHYQIKRSDDGMTFSVEEDGWSVRESISQKINVENADLIGMSKALIRIDESFEEFCNSAGVAYKREPELQAKLAKATERVEAVIREITPENDIWEFETLARTVIKDKLGIDLDNKKSEKAGFDEIE